MLKVTSVFLAVLMLTGVVGCAKKLPPQPVSEETLSQADLQYYWQVNLGLPRGETIDGVLLLDENLYCLTNRYNLYALDAARGLLKWSFQVATKGQTVFLPTHVDGLRLSKQPATLEEMLSSKSILDLPSFDAVLINTLSELLVLNRETGELQRRIPFDFAAHTSGVSDGKNFYCGSTRGRYYAIRMWESVQDWVLSASDMIKAPLRYQNNMLYVADESGTVIATHTGSAPHKVWTRKLEGAVTAPFEVSGKGCFVPCDDNRLYAFDPQNGQDLWQMPFVCQGPLYDAVQVGDELIYQYASGDMFYAINPSTGNQVWSILEGRQVLMIADGKLYLRCADNRLMVLDNREGTVIKMIPLTGWELYANNVKDSGIYMVSKNGRVGCLRLQSAGRLTQESLRN
jgi:outer membrane protein assembly factor BamB